MAYIVVKSSHFSSGGDVGMKRVLLSKSCVTVACQLLVLPEGIDFFDKRAWKLFRFENMPDKAAENRVWASCRLGEEWDREAGRQN